MICVQVLSELLSVWEEGSFVCSCLQMTDYSFLVPFTTFPQRRRRACLPDTYSHLWALVCWQFCFPDPRVSYSVRCWHCRLVRGMWCPGFHLLFCARIVKPEWPFLHVSRLSAICDTLANPSASRWAALEARSYSFFYPTLALKSQSLCLPPQVLGL